MPFAKDAKATPEHFGLRTWALLLHDHIVVAGLETVSFKERGLL
jgi:DNA repair protein RadC